MPPKRIRSRSPLAPPGQDIGYPPPEYVKAAALAQAKRPRNKAKPRVVNLEVPI